MSQGLEHQTVMAAQRGDRQAYTQLVRDHYQGVFMTCLAVVGNPHDAEDLAQEVFITGLQRLGQLRESGRFAAWITQIARNHGINHLRDKRRLKMKAEKLKQQPTGHEPTHAVELERALQQLPLELREPLVWHYLDGQSVQTIAARLKLSASTIYQKLRQAHQQLRDLLAQQGDVS